MKIALAQLECKLGDVAANVETMCRIVGESADGGADLVLFPEMSDTGYDMPTILRTACKAHDAPRTRLAESARRYNVNVIAGLSLREGGSVFNTSVAFDRSGAVIGEYRKIHLFTGEPTREDAALSAGDNRVIVEIDGVRTGLLICYDLRFPELSRSLMLEGAEMLACVAAWPAVRVAHWRLLAAARGLENLCVVAAVNRAGADGEHVFGGGSGVFTQVGESLANLGDGPRMQIVQTDVDSMRSARRTFPWLRDRRPECYADHNQRHRASPVATS
jgi:omega-amidase